MCIAIYRAFETRIQTGRPHNDCQPHCNRATGKGRRNTTQHFETWFSLELEIRISRGTEAVRYVSYLCRVKQNLPWPDRPACRRIVLWPRVATPRRVKQRHDTQVAAYFKFPGCGPRAAATADPPTGISPIAGCIAAFWNEIERAHWRADTVEPAL